MQTFLVLSDLTATITLPQSLTIILNSHFIGIIYESRTLKTLCNKTKCWVSNKADRHYPKVLIAPGLAFVLSFLSGLNCKLDKTSPINIVEYPVAALYFIIFWIATGEGAKQGQEG